MEVAGERKSTLFIAGRGIPEVEEVVKEGSGRDSSFSPDQNLKEVKNLSPQKTDEDDEGQTVEDMDGEKGLEGEKRSQEDLRIH